MTVYLDSSVFLRILLNQKGRLKEFNKISRAVGSLLLKTETLRTIDRLRAIGQISNDQAVTLASQAHESLGSVEFIYLTDSILAGAGGSFPIALGTLDAIHLVSAQTWRSSFKQDLVFLTHDQQLGKAATASGFEVLGAG
jgi:predicted nucleic acid-binding protein